MATRSSYSISSKTRRIRRPSMEMKMKINSLFLLLPVEIIREIFSRLPVDSVLQCKLVCKTWRDFIDHHHSNNNSNTVEMGGFLLRQRFIDQPGFYYGEYDDKVTCFNLTRKPVFNHDDQYPFEDPRNWYIIGSCNGLICLRQTWHGECNGLLCKPGTLYVSNPYTGEYAKLPIANYPRLDHDVNIGYGFGYHPTTKEYKVIRIYYHEISRRKLSVVTGYVQVYTLGSGTAWRSIGEIEHELYRSNMHGNESRNNSWGMLLNGVLYWLTKNKRLIISFDLADEEFRVIPSILPVFHGIGVLAVLSGCLCLSSTVLGSTQIWVMNDNDNSWSQKFSISTSWKCYCKTSRAYFPLAHLESGKILLHRNFDKMVSYDPETEHLVKLKKIDGMFDIIPYLKSSVSLKALGVKEAIQVKAKEENKNNKKKQQIIKRKGGVAHKQQQRAKKRNKLV